jgi:hypothetical protein
MTESTDELPPRSRKRDTDIVILERFYFPPTEQSRPWDEPISRPVAQSAEAARGAVMRLGLESFSPEGPAPTQHTNTTPTPHHHMPDISTFTESKFLKRGDVGAGSLLTIESCQQQNVAKAEDKPELKWCLFFQESDKPMVLNKTNAELCAQITGERNSDNWAGHKIVAYDDPSISYGGKLVGGIRIRAPRNKAATAPVKPKPADLPSDEDGDDIPF